MPLFDETQPTPPPTPKTDVNPAPPRFAGLSVDSKLFPRTGFMANVEGSLMTVKSYYSQLLNKGNQPMAYSKGLDSIKQQYHRIDRLEIRVDEPLAPSYSEGENEFSIVGGGTLYNGLIPNVDDVLLLDIGDGRLGRLSVTSAEPGNHLQATVYKIKYKIVEYASVETLADLDQKTMTSSIFVRDQYLAGNTGQLIEKDFDDYQLMQRLLLQLPNEYHRDFYSNEYKTYLVPDQAFTVYDPFVIAFFKRLVDPQDHPWIWKVSELNTDLGADREVFTVWDAALEGDESVIDRCQAKVAPITVSYFVGQPLFASVAYSGIDYCMYPTGLTLRYQRTDTVTHSTYTLQYGPNVTLNRKVTLAEAFSKPNANALPGYPEPARPWINDNLLKDTYVFSPAFYQNDPQQQSGVELLFRTAIRGTLTDNAQVIRACQDRVLWTSTTRYYYIPALLYCLRVALKNIG